ncbi:MAG: radical SAM protein [Deltaproteobacteria bacterium]|nr:radical SAM protein [Deltaproteobacteria bacterium]
MLLIHPPVVKPCEPPPGIAKIAGAMHRNGIHCTVLDANMEGLLHLMEGPQRSSDKWTARAARNLSNHLHSLRSRDVYDHFDRYKRAVLDLNRLVEMSTTVSEGSRVGLGNYQHAELSPVRSEDLIRAAERPEENPFFPYFSRRIGQILDHRPYKVVGLSLNFLSQALCAFAMMGFIRKEYPELTLALGGGLVTSWMRRPGWRNPFGGLVDEMVAGPGEEALLSLLGTGGKSMEHCTPTYEALPMEKYLSPGAILPYSASSGCYWNRCAFCPERAEGNPYAPLPVKRVLQDLNILVAQTRPVLIHLLDNAVSPRLMKGLALDPPGPPWYGFARITDHLADPDFCMALKRSGCVMLKLGLESGDQEVIDREEKGVDLAVASRALKTLNQAGIATYVYLLFGTPSETLNAARNTLRFTVKHSDCIQFLNLAIFNLPVYGPEASGLETKTLYEGDLSLYTGFSHPLGWDRGVVRQFLDKEFKRHPAVAKILRNDPPIFTSNHASFFRKLTMPSTASEISACRSSAI